MCVNDAYLSYGTRKSLFAIVTSKMINENFSQCQGRPYAIDCTCVYPVPKSSFYGHGIHKINLFQGLKVPLYFLQINFAHLFCYITFNHGR